MFNLGPEKILVILAIALVVLGPDKLPEAARKAGQVLGQLRRLSGGFEHEIRQALDEPMQAFHREFSAGEALPVTSNGATGNESSGDESSGDESSGDASSPTPDTAVPIDGSVAADPAAAADPALAEPELPADAATTEEPAVELSPAAAADQPPPSSDEHAAPASTSSLPSWVFGRGDDSGPALH